MHLVAVALVCVFPLVWAAAPVQVTDAKDKDILRQFLAHAERVPEQVNPDYCKRMAAEEPESYTWQALPQLSMLLTAYQLTADPKYLDLFVRTFENMRAALTTGPDGFLGWYGKAFDIFRDAKDPDKKVDVEINAFRAADVLTAFLEEVASDEQLSRRYARQQEQYLDLLENQLLKKWEVRGSYVDLGGTGAIYRTHPGLKDVKAHLTDPHNKQSIIVSGLLGLYRVTGKDDYMRKAVRIGTRFKHCLTLKDGHYEWNYWDPAGAWDVDPNNPSAWKHWIGPEHMGHYYSLSLTQAVMLYDHGVVFTRTDMDRFLKTQLEVCWNGDMLQPQWSRVDGSRPENYTQGAYICSALAPFSEKVAEFLYAGPRQDERLQAAAHPWQGGVVAGGWLSGKYICLPAARAGRQTHLAAGRRFLEKPENRDFAKALEFAVTGSAYRAPASPAQMQAMPQEPQTP
jgi:hypothetical protein